MSSSVSPNLPDVAFLEELTEGSVVSRRNLLLGLWAGRKLGLSGPGLQIYAKTIIETDFIEPGHEDVIRKLKQDFWDCGLEISREGILRELTALHREAYHHFLTTD